MQNTGTITSVTPTQEGGYQSQNGYIYTFVMQIQTDAGMIQGEIGSKTQLYPLGCGSPISVEVTQTEHGLKFKKFNPQYAGQSHQSYNPPPQQQSYTPPPQAAPPQQRAFNNQNQGRDYDKENRGKCRFGLYQACIRNGCNPAEMVSDTPLIEAIETLVLWSMEGPSIPQPTGGGPNPDYNPNPPAPAPGDDVPF